MRRILQYDCYEGARVDRTQARAVAKHKPDIILWESPAGIRGPADTLNAYPPKRKPRAVYRGRIAGLKRVARSYPWVASDVLVYEALRRLWESGHNVKVFHVDAPPELLREDLAPFKKGVRPEPKRRGTDLAWWVRIYLREKIMSGNIRDILARANKDARTLAFIQRFHWMNIRFLLARPTKREIWERYFGRFNGLSRRNIGTEVRKHPVLYKYWRRYSDFR